MPLRFRNKDSVASVPTTGGWCLGYRYHWHGLHTDPPADFSIYRSKWDPLVISLAQQTHSASVWSPQTRTVNILPLYDTVSLSFWKHQALSALHLDNRRVCHIRLLKKIGLCRIVTALVGDKPNKPIKRHEKIQLSIIKSSGRTGEWRYSSTYS